MEFRILGPLEVRDENGPRRLGGRKERGLLTLLLVNRGQAVTADRLIDELWGESPPPTAAKSLQVRISELRKALGEGVLVRRGSGYALEVPPGALDVERFEVLVAEGRRSLAEGQPDRAADALRSALALWRGPPLADFAYEPFAQSEIGRLEEARLAALEDRIEADLALGRHAELVAELDALVRAHPLRERLRRQLMLALYRSGRQAEALEVYRNARRALVDELGIEPGQELQQLERDILAQSPALLPPRKASVAGDRVRTEARRGALLVSAGAAVLVAAAIGAAIVALTRGPAATDLTSISPGSIGVIDPASNRLTGQIPVGSGPTSVAVGEGGVWVGVAGERTLARIDPETKEITARVGLGRIPSQLVVANGTVWAASAIGGRGTVSSVDPHGAGVISTKTVRVGDEGDLFAPATPSALAVGAGAVWTNRVRSKLAHFAVHGGPVETVDLGSSHSADGIAVGAGAVWVASSADDRLLRVDPSRNRVASVIPIAARPGARVAGPYAVAVGHGSVWVADALADAVSRVDPDLGAVTATIPVGRRPTRIAVGEGAVWVLNGDDGTVTRIDPQTDEPSATIPVGKGVTGLAAGAGAVWVTVGGGPAPSAGRSAARRFTPLPTSMCSRVYRGPREPELLIVSDLPTILYGARSPVIRDMRAAIRYVLDQRGFRAGGYAIGYQECDDSSIREGQDDPERCAANARAYAANASVVGVVGPYRSFCTALALPTLNAAPGGPVATVSPSNTYVGLTRAGPATAADEPDRYYPTGARNYARLVGADHVQGAALALLARQLGLRRIYLLDDGEGTGYAMRTYVADAARRLGVTVIGAGSWDDEARTYAPLAAAIGRRRADGVVLTGCMCLNGLRLVDDLRGAFGRRVPLLGSDNFTSPDLESEHHARTVDGVYVSYSGLPAEQATEKGRQFLNALAAERPAAAIDPHVLYAAQAVDLLMNGISRSNGTRASVANELVRTRVRDGIVGTFALDANGDPRPSPVGIYRIRARTPAYRTRTAKRLVLDRVIQPPRSLID